MPANAEANRSMTEITLSNPIQAKIEWPASRLRKPFWQRGKYGRIEDVLHAKIPVTTRLQLG